MNMDILETINGYLSQIIIIVLIVLLVGGGAFISCISDRSSSSQYLICGDRKSIDLSDGSRKFSARYASRWLPERVR